MKEVGVNFGKTLRCSPQKRDVDRRFTIPAGEQRARKRPNFSGAQKEKVMSKHSPRTCGRVDGRRRMGRIVKR